MMALGRGRCQTHGRADAPTGLWKTAPTRFPTAPTAIIRCVQNEDSRPKNTSGVLRHYQLEANTG